MAYSGQSPKVKRLRYTPQSSIPSNASEGDVYYEDGTNANEGLYLYKNGAWTILVAGSFPNYNVTTKTANYTLVSTDDVVLADTTSTAITLTLPAAASNTGKQFIIVKTNSGTNLVTLDGNASETINGQTTLKMGAQYASIKIISNGTNWLISSDKNPIRVRYTTNTAQSITNATNTLIDFEDLSIDTHNAVTVGIWLFTAPETATYSVYAAIATNESVWAAGEQISLELHKNGALYSYLDLVEIQTTPTGAYFMVIKGSDIVSLTAGDTLQIRVEQSSGSTIAIFNNGNYNRVTIQKI